MLSSVNILYVTLRIVVEEGDEVAPYASDGCLLMANHQDSLDVPLLMLAVQDKGDACCHLTWILDHMFRYTHFGLVCKSHGDIFVQSVCSSDNAKKIYIRAIVR
jgi:1-acyl-sn-glycerol-3-phosphate acyltransferase